MAITVNFYTFAKRGNSTKKPSGNGYSVDVTFKEDTDIERPILEIHDATILSYNYAYIAYTGRYYWVSSRRSIAKDTFEVELAEDYLASAISSIRGQNVYCELSSVDWQGLLDDPRIVPVPAILTYSKVDAEHFDLITDPDSTGAAAFVEVDAVITEDGAFGGIDIITSWNTAGDNYIQKVANPSFYSQIKSNLGGGDPMDYVCGIWAVPFKTANCHQMSADHDAKIGDSSHVYNVDKLSAYGLQAKRFTETLTLPAPTHTDFRYCEKYVKYYLLLPFIGVVKIPTDVVKESSQRHLTLSYSANIVSGELTFTVTMNGINLGIFSTNVKCALPLKSQTGAASHMFTNGALGAFSGAGTGLAMGGAWGAVGGAVTGAIGGVIKGAIDGADIERVMNSVNSAGVASTLADINKPSVIMIELDSDIEPNDIADVAGRICEKVVTVKNGYMKTRNASLSFAGTENEINEVNRAFNAGVYVE
jgi:hypothetical protein